MDNLTDVVEEGFARQGELITEGFLHISEQISNFSSAIRSSLSFHFDGLSRDLASVKDAVSSTGFDIQSLAGRVDSLAPQQALAGREALSSMRENSSHLKDIRREVTDMRKASGM